MNGLLLTVVIILLLCSWNGYRKGFIKIFFSLLSLVATIALVGVVAPYISGFLIEKTPVYDNLKINVTNAFAAAAEGSELAAQGPAEVIEAYPLPKGLKDLLIKNNNQDTYQVLMADIFEEYVSSYVARIIINSIAFVFAFLFITIALRMTLLSLDILSRLPVINGINRIIGLAAGFMEGLLLVWLLFVAATIFLNRESGQEFTRMVNESIFLTFLSRTNVLLHLISSFIS